MGTKKVGSDAQYARRAGRGLGVILGLLLAGSASASATEPQIAGYCWYIQENSILYTSAIFRADKADRDDWDRQWRNHLIRSEVKYFGGSNCRAWRGGADAVATAIEEDAKVPSHIQRVVKLDWVPDDTIGGSNGQSSERPSLASHEAVAPTKTPAASKVRVKTAGLTPTLRLSPEVAARNEAAAAEYRRKLAEREQSIALAKSEHDRNLAKHAESVAKAAAEKREYERQLAANAAQTASAQLEYKKALAKPAGVNAVYRGFGGPTCEIARNSAVRGSGTDSGTQFAEVTQDLSRAPGHCVVQGWWWSTTRTGSSRQ